MNRSTPEEERNKKLTKVTTFPVPFAVGEIKENITNTPSKPSKEQIINQAFKFHSQGNIEEAAKCYQDFIKKGVKDHIVFSNYGVILKNLGKLEASEIFTRKAIKINPEYPEAHANLGNILRDLGKSEEARLCSEKIMSLKSWSLLGSYSFNREMKLD